MHSDYGYSEEGELGKTYDLRLIKRLSRYAAPYRKPLVLALILTLAVTAIDLAVPYFSKIAIDRYILASWYRLEARLLTTDDAARFRVRYGGLLEEGREAGVYFVSHEGMKKLDPADLHHYRAVGVLKQERFYRVPVGEAAVLSALVPRESRYEETADGALLLPYSVLEGLSKEERASIRRQDLEGVALVAGIFLVFMVLSLLFGYAEHYLLEFCGQNMMQAIRTELFARTQSQGLQYFDRNPVGRLVTRATNDVENLNELFRSVSITIFKDFFLLAGIIVVLMVMDWRLALLSFILLPVIFVVTFVFSAKARDAFRRLRATIAKINAFLQERITGMRVIQLFTREAYQMKVFERINHENYLAGMQQIRVFALFMPVMELFSSFAVGLLVYYGGGEVIREQLTLGSLVAFIGYIQMFFRPVRDISEKYNIMQSAMASMERIFVMMDHREEIPEPSSPVLPQKMRGHLVFDRVSFEYRKDTRVLQDISFEIRPGETVALVGATGSGKTTIAHLAERFYDPLKGTIYLDGVDLRQWPVRALRSQMSLCMQDVFLFSGNLEDNISLGRSDLSPNAVRDAAETARALAFVKRHPEGFAREIGEAGSTLSAGERQLLSFARALAPRPRILILDEATSSVDPETETLIQEALTRMLKGRTNLVVAHRLSTIRDADRILVMHHGRIAEEGSHEQLMQLRGIYYRLSRLRQG